MAFVSFRDRKSFFDELDQLVDQGRISDAEADRLVEAPRIFVPLREVLRRKCNARLVQVQAQHRRRAAPRDIDRQRAVAATDFQNPSSLQIGFAQARPEFGVVALELILKIQIGRAHV